MKIQHPFMSFKHTDSNGDTTEVTCSSPVLPEVLEAFERFLKGAGYSFDGSLDIYKEDEHE